MLLWRTPSPLSPHGLPAPWSGQEQLYCCPALRARAGEAGDLQGQVPQQRPAGSPEANEQRQRKIVLFCICKRTHISFIIRRKGFYKINCKKVQPHYWLSCVSVFPTYVDMLGSCTTLCKSVFPFSSLESFLQLIL